MYCFFVYTDCILIVKGLFMGKTIVHGNFEWDEEKTKISLSKHRIDFLEILSMFDDPLFWEQFDSVNSTINEIRYLGIGKVNGLAIIVSSYTERNGRTRIINARITTAEEEVQYERWCEQFYN